MTEKGQSQGGGSGTFKVKADQIPIVGSSVEIPSIFCDVIRGSVVTGGNAKVTLMQHRVDAETSQIKAVPVMTVIAPASQLRYWARHFEKMANDSNLPPIDG
jgi:hypothetical protein